MPSEICKLCFDKLIQCYEFRRMCRDSNNKLHSSVVTKEDHNYFETDDSNPDKVDSDSVSVIEIVDSDLTETEEPTEDSNKQSLESVNQKCTSTPDCSKTKFHSNSKSALRLLKTQENSNDLVCKV